MSYFPIFDHHLHLYSWYSVIHLLLLFLVFPATTFGLNLDGVLLQSFKSNIIKDPFGVLENWNLHNDTPCSWFGVTCGLPGSGEDNRVTTLSLPNSQLLGSIPSNLGMIPFLQSIDLSNNSINGSLPVYLFNSSQLKILDFSNNLISGVLPELIAGLTNLQFLNLSGNALTGQVPENLTSLHNLTVISLKSNYLSGSLPTGFKSVQFLDLSSNFVNGTLPPNFGGDNITYLNLSYNKLSGEIPPEFATKLPVNATIDLSFNNFTGEIPESPVFLNQDSKSFSGNDKLCGVPLNTLCQIPSNSSSPPAFAAIPKTMELNNPDAASPGQQNSKPNSLKLSTILGIVVGDIIGIGIISLVFIYVHKLKKNKRLQNSIKQQTESVKDFDWASSSASQTQSQSEENNWFRTLTCLRKTKHGDDGMTSETMSSDSEEENNNGSKTQMGREENGNGQNQEEKKGALVTVDGEKELELEILLKASAYMLGATGSSIIYKAVLEDGTTLAVRRIGESGVERFRDFENQVRVISKLVHPNLVKIRGFYWGEDEKLVIYDFVPNGSLANARYKKAGSSPCHLPWDIRLKISKGVARGLTYIHEKKHIHGNLKPSNILLGSDMEPKIGDFGLERLVTGENSSKGVGSSRIFGSKRSTASRDSFQDFTFGPTPSPSPSSLGLSPYHAPESLRSIKPNPKWDVFSFGVVLLELLTGKLIVSDETGPGPVLAVGSATLLDDEEKSKVLKMADMVIRADLEGKEDALLAVLRLGYSCISPVPQKRPSMKEVVQSLEKFPSSSPLSYHYGH